MGIWYGAAVTVLLSCLDLSGAAGSQTNLSLNACAALGTEEAGAQQGCQSIKKNNKHIVDIISKNAE